LKNLFLLFIFFSFEVFSQSIETTWRDDFKKELSVSCKGTSDFCHRLCSSESNCHLEEGVCRNCIGTGLKINYILSELGRSIHTSEEVYQSDSLISLLKNNTFATLRSNDPYNIIDSFGSIRVYKKFESLCREGSLSQILFLKISPIDRSIIRPELVYCEYEESISFLKIHLSPDLETTLLKFSFLPLIY
jgi:hypothetical protein